MILIPVCRVHSCSGFECILYRGYVQAKARHLFLFNSDWTTENCKNCSFGHLPSLQDHRRSVHQILKLFSETTTTCLRHAECHWSQLPDRGLWVRGACRRSARLNCATPRTTFLSFIHRKYPPLVLEGHVLSNTAWTPGGGRQKRRRRRRENIRRREETKIRLKEKCCC